MKLKKSQPKDPRRRTRASTTQLKGQSFPLSKAKTYLGRLLQKAMSGETIYIVARNRRFILQEVPEIEPIPMRPPGYFAACYSREENELDRRLTKASVLTVPKDLE